MRPVAAFFGRIGLVFFLRNLVSAASFCDTIQSFRSAAEPQPKIKTSKYRNREENLDRMMVDRIILTAGVYKLLNDSVANDSVEK